MLPTTTFGSDYQLFVRFRFYWSKINQISDTLDATSHTLWMSRLINSLIIFMFSEKFHQNNKEKIGLE